MCEGTSQTFTQNDYRDGGRSENLGWRVKSNEGGHNLSPVVEIGLTDLPKSGGRLRGRQPIRSIYLLALLSIFCMFSYFLIKQQVLKHKNLLFKYMYSNVHEKLIFLREFCQSRVKSIFYMKRFLNGRKEVLEILLGKSLKSCTIVGVHLFSFFCVQQTTGAGANF